MTIGLNGVSFGEAEKKKSGSGFPILTTAAGAAVGGLLLGENINGLHVLKKDTFELKGNPAGDQPVVNQINERLAAAKEDKVNAAADEKINSFFPDKDAKEIPIAEYLQKKGYATTDAAEVITKFEADVKSLNGEAQTIKDQLKKAEQQLKSSVEADKPAAESLVKEMQDKLAKNTKEISAKTAELEILKSAKDSGKITRDVLKSNAVKEVKSGIVEVIDDLLKQVKTKLPKMPSLKKAGIGAAIGLAAGVLLNGMFAPKPSQES